MPWGTPGALPGALLGPPEALPGAPLGHVSSWPDGRVTPAGALTTDTVPRWHSCRRTRGGVRGDGRQIVSAAFGVVISTVHNVL